jgi:hypothetical protein
MIMPVEKSKREWGERGKRGKGKKGKRVKTNHSATV